MELVQNTENTTYRYSVCKHCTGRGKGRARTDMGITVAVPPGTNYGRGRREVCALHLIMFHSNQVQGVWQCGQDPKMTGNGDIPGSGILLARTSCQIFANKKKSKQRKKQEIRSGT